MKLSQLISKLQATLDDKGDTEEVALCFVIEGKPACRLDVFGSVTVLHDTTEYINGMAYLISDCNLRPTRLKEVEPCAHEMKPTGMYEPFDMACEQCGSFDTIMQLNRDEAGRDNTEIKGERS